MRNPWGSGEWKGDYSDKSPLWNNDLKKKVNFTDVDDGTFYMKFEDFTKNFDGATVCHYRNDYTLSSIHDFNGENDFAIYQFNIEKNGDYYFGMSQPDKNMMKAGHTYGMLSVIIARIDEGGKREVEYIGGKGYPKRDIWFMAACKKGKYLAFVNTHWDNANSDEFSLWSYGPKLVKFQRVEEPPNIKKGVDYFEKTMKDKVIILIEKKKFTFLYIS